MVSLGVGSGQRWTHAGWHLQHSPCCRPKKSTPYQSQEEHENGNVVGLDVGTGEPLDPTLAGIYDNYNVKRQILQSGPVIASQLLLVDEVLSLFFLGLPSTLARRMSSPRACPVVTPGVCTSCGGRRRGAQSNAQELAVVFCALCLPARKAPLLLLWVPALGFG